MWLEKLCVVVVCDETRRRLPEGSRHTRRARHGLETNVFVTVRTGAARAKPKIIICVSYRDRGEDFPLPFDPVTRTRARQRGTESFCVRAHTYVVVKKIKGERESRCSSSSVFLYLCVVGNAVAVKRNEK